MPLQDVDVFDVDRFHMNKGEALALDPQARLLLHITCEALHDAGGAYNLESMGSRTGTYVGCMFMDYMNLLRVGLDIKHSGPVMTGAGRALCNQMLRMNSAALTKFILVDAAQEMAPHISLVA